MQERAWPSQCGLRDYGDNTVKTFSEYNRMHPCVITRPLQMGPHGFIGIWTCGSNEPSVQHPDHTRYHDMDLFMENLATTTIDPRYHFVEVVLIAKDPGAIIAQLRAYYLDWATLASQ